MTDDRFEEFLKRSAGDYNRPPEIPPREAMWSAIESARAARAVRPLRLETVAASGAHRRSPLRTWLGLAAAAAAFLAVGIGIGRSTGSDMPRVAQAPPGGPLRPGERAAVSTPGNAPDAVAEIARENAPGAALRPSDHPRAEVSIAQHPAGRPGGRPIELAVRGGTAGPPGATSYQFASLRHLTEAEAMLTLFRSDSAEIRMDAAMTKWSRDLLANTRLLLDSPAARDPLRRRLLEDLELVLAQIVQTSSQTGDAQDRSMIENSIREGQVMTRLRTAIPAGQPSGS